MLCVKSTPGDYSTSDVLAWLKYFNAEFVFLDKSTEQFNDILISNDSAIFKSNKEEFTFDLNQIDAYWYRRGSPIQLEPPLDSTIINKREISSNILSELFELNTFILSQIHERIKSNSINSTSIGNLNRLKVFKVATEFGLKIPKYIITNNKNHLLQFYNVHKEIVLKPISNVRSIKRPDGEYLQYTKIISKDDLELIPNSFFPSLFQQYIKKDFEIRSFFLNDKFYSMAIFSQKNSQTRIDFRKYDLNNPNVRVPFKLPENIENNISKVFNSFGLNCGSVDLLHTSDDEYYFLEINPVGQFGMVSYPCNYYLEKEIAETLIAHETKITKGTT